ncbi:MAG: hypothetical protein G8345_18445 [Magnetococcales bacterium]|nr:hypothetical protein [Magnetococcales bacterium]
MSIRQVWIVGLFLLVGGMGTFFSGVAVADKIAGNPVVGTYDVVGTNPMDNSPYEGVATVTKQGEALRIMFQIDGKSEAGVGILDNNVLAVSWIFEKKPTVLLMYPSRDGGWYGQWAYNKDTRLGSETWTRR